MYVCMYRRPVAIVRVGLDRVSRPAEEVRGRGEGAGWLVVGGWWLGSLVSSVERRAEVGMPRGRRNETGGGGGGGGGSEISHMELVVL